MIKRYVLALSCCAFLCRSAFGGDLATEVVPEKIHYMKHGVPRVRTGAPYDMKRETLVPPVRPGAEPVLTYKPADGYGLEALGLRVKPSLTFVLQGTPNPNLSPATGKLGVSYNLYIDFEKKLEEWGFLFCQVMSGGGDTVVSDLNLFSNVNYNEYDISGKVTLRRYYYEQYMLDRQVTLRIGMVKATDWYDQNNGEDDSDTQFLNDIFNTSQAVEWPSSWATTFSEQIVITPSSPGYAELSLGHFEGEANWKKFFKYGLYIAQAAIRTDKALGLDPKKWTGHYRIYGWINNREHQKLAGKGEMPVHGSFVNYGFGVSIDQMIGPWLDVFGRAGWQRPNVKLASSGATIEWSWSAGMQINGCLWKRVDDRLAFAAGQDFVSKEYIDAGNPGSNEGHIEIYYTWKLNPCLSISPDIQLVWNPNGVSSYSRGDADTIVAYATRLHYVF